MSTTDQRHRDALALLMLQLIARGEADYRAGRVLSDRDARARLRRRLADRSFTP